MSDSIRVGASFGKTVAGTLSAADHLRLAQEHLDAAHAAGVPDQCHPWLCEATHYLARVLGYLSACRRATDPRPRDAAARLAATAHFSATMRQGALLAGAQGALEAIRNIRKPS